MPLTRQFGIARIFKRRLFAQIVVTLAVAALALFSLAPAAQADSGTIRISFFKGGWIIGGAVGEGTLTFRGKRYPLRIGGLSYGLTFGGSQTNLRGRVRNINRPSDVAGVYGAAGAGAAVLRGAQAVVLTNPKGTILELSGTQTGLIINVDLSGLAISLR